MPRNGSMDSADGSRERGTVVVGSGCGEQLIYRGRAEGWLVVPSLERHGGPLDGERASATVRSLIDTPL